MRPEMVHRLRTAEELADAEAIERARQRAARVEAFAVDRSRFAHPLLEQASRQMASDHVDAELVIEQRYKTPATRVQALRGLTAKPSLWRRLIWGER